MDKQKAYCLPGARVSGQEADGVADASCTTTRHACTLPRFRGVLLCRRCDSCGTRISFKGEGKDKLLLTCPECQREYVFFQRS